jgi:hypothetical protein
MSTQTQYQELYQLAIDIGFYINSIANQKYYNSGESCVSYMNSTVVQWKNEATAFNSWRDQCWLIINPIIQALQPTDPVPTIDEIVALLPAMVWPD